MRYMLQSYWCLSFNNTIYKHPSKCLFLAINIPASILPSSLAASKQVFFLCLPFFYLYLTDFQVTIFIYSCYKVAQNTRFFPHWHKVFKTDFQSYNVQHNSPMHISHHKYSHFLFSLRQKLFTYPSLYLSLCHIFSLFFSLFKHYGLQCCYCGVLWL